MNLKEQLELIPKDFPESSRVWIYQSNRPFQPKEKIEIKEQLEHFYLQWNVHGAEIKGWAGILFDHFIVFIADDSAISISGCSIDSSVKVLKSIERQYNVQLFDRMTITLLVKDSIQMLPFSQLQYALEKEYITSHTLVFNNLIDKLIHLRTGWLVPLKDSWIKSHVQIQ